MGNTEKHMRKFRTRCAMTFTLRGTNVLLRLCLNLFSLVKRKKQSILCLKCNLLNTTFLFNCCYYKINIAFAHMLMFRKMTIWCSFRFLINYWTVANIISATLSNRIILIINQNHKTSQNSSNPLVIHCFLMFVLLISLQNDATSWKMMSARKWLLLVKGVLTKD